MLFRFRRPKVKWFLLLLGCSKVINMKATLHSLRKALHRFPNLSGQEEPTAERIQEFLQEFAPTQLRTGLGGAGLVAVYEFGPTGPGVLIRCELDALPIQEANDFSHRSQHPGVSHKCGHDGHMTMVAGLAAWLQKQQFSAGRVVLLFQPAEETGKGAAAVLESDGLQDIPIDYAFALHNIPGEPLHTVLLMEQGFSAEVQSFCIRFSGKTAHAAEPEEGINPTGAIAELIQTFAGYNQTTPTASDFAILTPIHIKVGEPSYGVAPGAGELHYTIRTWNSKAMQQLVAKIEQQTAKTSELHDLAFQLNWFEHFPASTNDASCNTLIEQAAEHLHLLLREMPHPFRFGEDFGWFSQHYKTGMFGLGAGLDTPALHHADYDFPDELLETGVGLFQAIITQILEAKN